MRRLLLLVLLAAAATPGNAGGEPRLTLRLEGVTLAETLRHLERFYGRSHTAPAGSGDRRASFDWQDAGVGAVLRDVAAQFQVTPHPGRDGAVRWETGAAPRNGLELTREGVTITLLALRQRETRAVERGQNTGTTARLLTVSLAVRPVDGDPQALFGIEGLRARDSAGRVLRPAAALQRPAADAFPGFPDEWRLEAVLPEPAAAARELTGLEGEVVLYRTARAHRVEVPAAAVRPEAAYQAGPVQVRQASLEGREAGFVLVWPRGVEVVEVGGEDGRTGVALFARDESGGLRPVPLVFGGTLVDERGEHSAQYTVRRPVTGPPPAAWVWQVGARANPDRRVPFRFGRLPLPLATEGVGLAPPHAGTASLLVTLPAPLARAGELTLGFSRLQGRTPGPVRWGAFETDDDGTTRVDDLAPGDYRIQATFRARDSRGNLGPARPLRAVPTLRLAPGRIGRVLLARP